MNILSNRVLSVVSAVIIATGVSMTSVMGWATEQASERRDARDTKQDTRQDARDTKQDCRADNDQRNAECRQDKRDDKQEGREEARDIKY